MRRGRCWFQWYNIWLGENIASQWKRDYVAYGVIQTSQQTLNVGGSLQKPKWILPKINPLAQLK